MAVMNYAAFSAAQQLDYKDAVAVRNAFLKYSLQEQAELLVKMPISEALAMLHECPLRHVQLLLDCLDEMNEELRMRQLANGLGLIVLKQSLLVTICKTASLAMLESVLAGLSVLPF